MKTNQTRESTATGAAPTTPRGSMSRLSVFLGGFVLGAVSLAVVGWLAMPHMMLTTHQSRYNTVEETCTQLQAAIAASGWTSPPVRDMNKSLAAQGIQMDEPIRIVELCNAAYAKNVLASNPEVSTLMPCAWGVYQGRDGKVCITGIPS